MNPDPKPTATSWKARWLRRIWRLAATGIALLLLIGIADFFYFRASVPLNFYDANWTGRWKTEDVGWIRGRLLVKLPDPLPENESFYAQALVYYPIYSVYRTGQFVPMDFEAEYSPNKASSSGAAETPLALPGGKLKFKGMAGRQVVDYIAIFSDDQRRIIGCYESDSPYDYGHFVLNKQ